MHEDIRTDAANAGIALSLDDVMQGSLFVFVTPSGRTNNYTTFDGNVIRIGTDWEAAGVAHDPRGSKYDSNYAVTYSERDHVLTIRFHTWVFAAPLSSGIYHLVNSPGTDELYLRVLQDLPITQPAQYHAVLKAGGFFYCKDS